MARELAQHCELRDLGGTDRPASFPDASPPADETRTGQAAAVAGRAFRPALQLAIELEEGTGDTPAAAAQRDRRERMDRAIASVEQDGFVREVIEMFDATLIESSIKPV
jgi:DNA polymerase-3 subunit gamma/tau